MKATYIQAISAMAAEEFIRKTEPLIQLSRQQMTEFYAKLAADGLKAVYRHEGDYHYVFSHDGLEVKFKTENEMLVYIAEYLMGKENK